MEPSETDLLMGGKDSGDYYKAVVEFTGDALAALREKADQAGQSYWALIQDAVLSYQPPASDHYHPWPINLTPEQQAHIDAANITPQVVFDRAMFMLMRGPEVREQEQREASDKRMWELYVAYLSASTLDERPDNLEAAWKFAAEAIYFFDERCKQEKVNWDFIRDALAEAAPKGNA